MKKFCSIIAAVVVSATVMSGNAWAAVATYSWTIADYVDDVDNGINIGMGSEQSVNADTLDLTGETALELLYASGANKTCTFGCRPTAYSYDGFSYRYFVKLKNGDGTLIIPHISGSGKLTLVVGDKRERLLFRGVTRKVKSQHQVCLSLQPYRILSRKLVGICQA